ncbi:MAG TPA: DUF4293 family protein, partial [Agriterribacter sp.]|nr:DUF4293 family protein [Agriterribacter sp.]
KLCLAALGVYIICCVLYFTQIKQYNVGALSLWSGLYFLIPILLILAMIGIYKDTKLIKSIDRLR